MSKVEYRTCGDWISAGYCILKGQHALKKDTNGKPTFSRYQVAKIEYRNDPRVDGSGVGEDIRILGEHMEYDRRSGNFDDEYWNQ